MAFLLGKLNRPLEEYHGYMSKYESEYNYTVQRTCNRGLVCCSLSINWGLSESAVKFHSDCSVGMFNCLLPLCRLIQFLIYLRNRESAVWGCQDFLCLAIQININQILPRSFAHCRDFAKRALQHLFLFLLISQPRLLISQS